MHIRINRVTNDKNLVTKHITAGTPAIINPHYINHLYSIPAAVNIYRNLYRP